MPNPTHTPGPWRCFHCGDVFTDHRDAAMHFGPDDGKTPACQIKGSEHGLLRALRDAETEADEAIQRMHAESTDAAKAYHRQRCRHNQAMMAAEECGYAKGLADGRTVDTELLSACSDWIAYLDADGEEGDGNDEGRMLAAMRAAITKATGHG